MRSKIGQTAEVLYEADGRGLCEHYVPVFVGNDFSAGDFVSVKLTGIENGIFTGSVL